MDNNWSVEPYTMEVPVVLSLNPFIDMFHIGWERSLGIDTEWLTAEGHIVLGYRENMGLCIQFQSIYYLSPVEDLPEWWTVV